MPKPIQNPLTHTQHFFNSAAPEVAALLDVPNQMRKDRRLLEALAQAFHDYDPSGWQECRADREKPGYYDHDHAADAPPVPDPETNT